MATQGTPSTQPRAEADRVDYFISRTGADANWASWIAWELEEAGYAVIVQDWDFKAGSNFISNMSKALDRARTTIAVYSPEYFESTYTEQEWTAALVRRDDGEVPLLPVRVAQVDVPRLLRPYTYVDFVGVDMETARTRLLEAVRKDTRSKPPEEPMYPGGRAGPAYPAPEPRPVLADAPTTDRGARLVNRVPVETARFADRVTQQAQLRGYLADPSVRLVSITGRPGIGKSALASRVLTSLDVEPGAGEADGAKVDVILVLNARTTGLSFERFVTDAKTLLDEGAASRLAEFWSRQDVTLAQKVEAIVDALAERHVVVLLDGLESALGPDGLVREDGLRALIDACLTRSAAPRITATSRVALRLGPEVLADVRSVPLLEGLETDDAIELLKNLDPQGSLGLADADHADLLRAVALTGAIPRALELLAGILQNDPAANLRRLLDDQQAVGNQVVETLIAEGYRSLSPDDRSVMEALAAFNCTVSEAAVSYVVHQWNPQVDVRAALVRLVGSYFATADRTTGTYLIQSADRAHAYAQLPAQGVDAPPYNRAAVESRVADYYRSIRKPPEHWRSIEDLAPQITEFGHRVLAGEYDTALEVIDPIDSQYLFLWGHYSQVIELRKRVLDAPTSPQLSAANGASLALASQVLGNYDEALPYYEQAVDTAARTGDTAAHARYVGDLGRLYRNLGYMDKAIASSQEALDAAIAASDRAAEGRWKDRLGLVYAFVGRLDEGLSIFDEAVAIAREFGDRRSEGAALSNRGLILQIQGKVDAAEDAYRESLAIAREVSDRRGDAIIMGRLGFVAEGRGDYEAALRLHREALDVSVALGERREQSYQLLGLGRARLGLDQLEDAEQLLRQARDLDMPETGYQAGMALSLVLLRSRSAGARPSAAEAIADTVRRCDDRLARSAQLYGARFVRATALVAGALIDHAWAGAGAAQRAALLAPSVNELDAALSICPAPGIVAATMRDLDALPTEDPAALAPVRSQLAEVLERAPDVGPARPARITSDTDG